MSAYIFRMTIEVQSAETEVEDIVEHIEMNMYNRTDFKADVEFIDVIDEIKGGIVSKQYTIEIILDYNISLKELADAILSIAFDWNSRATFDVYVVTSLVDIM